MMDLQLAQWRHSARFSMAGRAIGRLGYHLAAIKPITWLDPDDQGDVRCSGEWARGTNDVPMTPYGQNIHRGRFSLLLVIQNQ